jgi:hypothetical protein
MHRKIYWLAILLVFACKEPYTPPAVAGANNTTLVVEGTINVGQDSTVIRLTNTKNLTDTGQVSPVTGGNITVQSQDGGSFPLQELGNGYYATPSINGSTTTNYRLEISLPSGKQYVSDYVPFVPAPAIDSLTWLREADGVHIFVNSHDNTNATKYYRWNYVETWENDAPYQSYYYYLNGQFFLRDSSQMIYKCYKSANSSTISIFSTTQLSQDVVSQQQVALVPLSSEKIGFEYSILVNQYGLTSDAYNYWQTLSANTQNLGSLFDPLPSELTGNVHCVTSSSEIVLGYISASSPQQKRIFIQKSQVQPWFYPPLPSTICDSAIAATPLQQQQDFGNGANIPVNQLPNMGPWWGAPPDCVDCRLNGGILTKPPFWP